MGAIVEQGLELFQQSADAGRGEKWTSERVLSVRYWTPTLLSFRTTRYRAFRFTPGHYARLGLGADDNIVWRPYSLASAAYENFLEFIAVLVPGGEGLARKCSNSAPSSVTTPNSSHKACARWWPPSQATTPASAIPLPTPT